MFDFYLELVGYKFLYQFNGGYTLSRLSDGKHLQVDEVEYEKLIDEGRRSMNS